jgi:hypothetical protein
MLHVPQENEPKKEQLKMTAKLIANIQAGIPKAHEPLHTGWRGKSGGRISCASYD